MAGSVSLGVLPLVRAFVVAFCGAGATMAYPGQCCFRDGAASHDCGKAAEEKDRRVVLHDAAKPRVRDAPLNAGWLKTTHLPCRT
jgi:hypothetical protein